MRKIYVASSWKNKYQPQVVEELKIDGHEVYDFRNPYGKDTGFSWAKIDLNWESWTLSQYLRALEHPRAIEAFHSDKDALDWSDTVIMVLPCGDSSHTELGYGIGTGKQTGIYMPEGIKSPELMYKFVNQMSGGIGHLLRWLNSLGTEGE